MRFVRFGPPGAEKPGALDKDGTIRDLSSVVRDIEGFALVPESLDRVRGVSLENLPPVPANVRIGACVGNVRNVVCIGLNYSDHAAETNTPLPTEPVVFNKHTAAISGAHDAVICPPGAKKVDWEVELGVIIGRPCWNVGQSNALDYVAGYCVVNDVSERAYQLEMSGQWTKGKSYRTWAPIGPWLVTADEVPDPQALDLWLDVNGTHRQRANTRTMIFPVTEIVSYLSRLMALQAGDVIATGTPPGVGMGHTPPIFLQVGDTMRVGVQGLGEQQQRVVAFDQEMAAAWSQGSTRLGS